MTSIGKTSYLFRDVRVDGSRVGATVSAGARPVQHLRNLDDTERIDRADLAVQDRAGVTVVLDRDERLVVEQVLHALEQRNQLRANEHHTSRRDGLGVDQARAGDDRGLLRRAVVRQDLVQTHQVRVVDDRTGGAPSAGDSGVETSPHRRRR
jgi:hypothetical protein